MYALSDTDIRSAICTVFDVYSIMYLEVNINYGWILFVFNIVHEILIMFLCWQCLSFLCSLSNIFPGSVFNTILRKPSQNHLHSQLSYLATQKRSMQHTGIDRQKSTQETFQDWFSR